MAEAKRRTSELKSVTDDKALAATAIGKAAAAEHRLYNLGRLISAWIWETDAEFRLTDVSYRVFGMLGLHPQELIGRRLRDIGSFVTLEDFPAGGESQSTFRDVFFEVPDREGQKRLFLVSGLPVYDQDTGAFRGMQGIADAADELSVSQHTVRTHVKLIFSKTTTERQSGLIRLLLSGPASVSPD